MLSESSYLTALYSYTGAAVIMLLYLAWWLSRHWRALWVLLAVLLGAALLLTPAYPSPDAATMAPALVVVAFQLLTDGPEAAMHNLRILGYACGVAVVLAILLRLLFFRGRQAPKEEPQGADLAEEASA